MSQFENNLQKYANLLVRVGNNVQAGQRLMIVASLDDDPIIRRLVQYVVKAAYQAGAKFVKVDWRDEQLTKIRLEHAPDESFDETDEFYYHARKEITEEGGGMIFLIGGDPDLLAGQDQEKIARMGKASGKLFRPISLLSDQGYGTWTIGAIAVQSWADKMLPDIPADQRIAKLWDYIFETCRITLDDPVEAWRIHAEDLQARAKYLTDKQYSAVKFTATGTELTIGLPDNHIWIGGGEENNQNLHYMPNIPTEEVFTMPHKDKVNGTVTASKPLSYSGTLIENFTVTFKDGKVVDFTAETGGDAFQNLLDMDEGSSYLGEVALAPSTSPIAQTGRLFYETLFDENAANHIALGNPYRINVQGGPEMSEEEFAAVGGNDSISHVDFMIGSTEMAVDGITVDGTAEPIMRDGDWAFRV